MPILTDLAAEVASQAAYHRDLFESLYDWGTLWTEAVDMAGTETYAAALGLDQMGHFGPRGVSLVVEHLVEATPGELTRVVEVGTGFGGALRQASRELQARGHQPLLAGVEFVTDHCVNATAIGRSFPECRASIVQADVRWLPLASASVDAVFAAGSASHFSSIPQVLCECSRVLRRGGVLVMTEEVSLRPAGGAAPGEAFVRHHPPDVFHAATREQRHLEMSAAGLHVNRDEPLARWATPLLRQRVQALKLLEHCARRMFGGHAYEGMVGTLTSAADEYERGAIEPTLVVARKPS